MSLMHVLVLFVATAGHRNAFAMCSASACMHICVYSNAFLFSCCPVVRIGSIAIPVIPVGRTQAAAAAADGTIVSIFYARMHTYTLTLCHVTYTSALEQFYNLHIYPQNVNDGCSNCSFNTTAAVKHAHALLRLPFYV